MLKLEKKPRNQEITVTLRDRDRRFNRTFLTAFAIAASLHLFAGILFQIRPFLLGSSEKILPPVSVNADLTGLSEEKDKIALAQLDKTERLPRTIQEPRYSSPALPALPPASIQRRIEYVMKNDLQTSPFAKMENEISSPDFTAMERHRLFTPLSILISGNLADKIIENDGLNATLASMTKALPGQGNAIRHSRSLYAVQMENQSGQIFWYEPQEKPDNPAHKQIAESILQHLRFQQESHPFVTTGEIEIVFAVPEPEHES